MFEVRLIKTNSIIPAAEELLNGGQRVRITVTGMSMYPFLRGNKDRVELVRTNFSEIKRGDIVLAVRENKQYVLHRVIKKKKNYVYINGDAQQWCEGPIYPEQIIARVIAIWRLDNCIPCSGKGWKALTSFWRILFPFRYLIIKSYRQMRKVLSIAKFGRKLT
ncbi:MAG: S24/S26 family peptidase [Anaerocolumna sp.]